jgi:hypothetical protein
MSAAAYGIRPKAPGAPLLVEAPAVTALSPNGRRAAQPSRPAAAADTDSARAIAISVIRRIESYLDEETAALDKFLDFDFKASNDRKSQGLVDLNQALRRLKQNDLNPDMQARLVAFRGKLAKNLHKIRLHLDAVKEIASMLSEAIQNAESDGTYTRNIGPNRGAP